MSTSENNQDVDRAQRRPDLTVEASRMTSVTIVGIDPGIASTGYGVVEWDSGSLIALDGGVIRTDAAATLETRLASIAQRMEQLIAAHRPGAVAVEDIFFGRNVQTAFAVGQARGAVLAMAGRHGLPCTAYTPQAIKRAVCGSGSAGKQQVQRMVTALLSLAEPPQPDHVADALAVAICHAHTTPGRLALQAAGA